MDVNHYGFCRQVVRRPCRSQRHCSDNIIVCGDLNCPGVDSTHVDSTHDDDELAAAFDSFGLWQLAQSPTRCDYLLDVLALIDPADVSGVPVSDGCYICDHRLITVNIVVQSKITVIRHLTSRPLKFQDALESSALFTQPAATVNDFANQLKTFVTHVLNWMAPLHTDVCHPAKPAIRWLSSEAIKTKRLRLWIEWRWLTTKDKVNRIAYRCVCLSTNKIINKSQNS